MAKKRERLEVIHDILKVIMDNGKMGPTRLLYASNLSPQMFKEYIEELKNKNLIEQTENKGKKTFSLSKKGFEFLTKYKEMVAFIEDFGL